MAEIYIEETVKFNHRIEVNGIDDEEIENYIDELNTVRIDSVDDLIHIVKNKYGDENVVFVHDKSGEVDEIEIE